MSLHLAVVVASLELEKTKPYWESWAKKAKNYKDPHGLGMFSTVVVLPEGKEREWRGLDSTFEATVVTGGIVGVLPAFVAGVRKAAAMGADLIACFHDDLRIDEEGWDEKVIAHFESHPRTGLAGFFGARSLGAGDIYQTPYNPMQLARGGTMQNMENGEMHGERVLEPRRAVCFDGFSQIGRAGLMVRLYGRLEELGIIHHCYDSALGAMSIREGWENWYLPIACHHAGGTTAVGSAAYNEWAKKKDKDGDQGFWSASHRILYEDLRNCLPLWVS